LHSNVLASVMAAESSGIRRLRDLEGRRVAVLQGGTNTQLFPGLARVAGFDAERVELVPLELPFFPHLAAGRVDASLEFVPSRFAVEQAVGEPLVVIPYADWLPELPGLALGVTAETARERPEMVRAFNQVATRAMQQSVAAPEEAAAMAEARERTSTRRWSPPRWPIWPRTSALRGWGGWTRCGVRRRSRCCKGTTFVVSDAQPTTRSRAATQASGYSRSRYTTDCHRRRSRHDHAEG